jgi:MerR family transcriptional regulator, Zn(II)-responsive regulator of zntA
MKTADVMKTFGIGRNTLRLYESKGLLSGLSRTDAGYRRYTETQVGELSFILKAKDAGFTLNEIASLLSMARDRAAISCGKVSEETRAKLEEIEAEIETLKAKKAFLSNFAKACSGQSPDTECNILGRGFVEAACC